MDKPVFSLRERTLKEVVYALEGNSARGNDWRGFAECVGFASRHIRAIEPPHGGSFTNRVLRAWDASGKSSVRKLIIALRCLERADCTRILESEPALKGEDFAELYRIADRLKNNEDERQATFPPFDVADLDLFPEDSRRQPCPPCDRHDPCVRSLPCERDSYQQLAAASSPNEERPPSSVSHSEATDPSPSKREVFISYLPGSNTTHQVEKLARQLEANYVKVHYATERQMTDPDFKFMAMQKAYNIVVVCTHKYYEENQRLLTNPGYPSKIAIDRKIVQKIFFEDHQRIICVSLDCDGQSCNRWVPDLYCGRPFYQFPSNVEDLLRCVLDLQKFIAPDPVARISLAPVKISYEKEARKWNALHGTRAVDTRRERAHCHDKTAALFSPPLDLRPQKIKTSSPPLDLRPQKIKTSSAPLDLRPRKIHSHKTPLWKKLLPAAVK